MPLETIGRVSAETHGRGKPKAATVAEHWYEVELPSGERRWLRGVELLEMPAPLKVTAIAWRV